MIKTIGNAGRPRRVRSLRHPVGLTALVYLKDALLQERYENCSEIIAVAKEFGAETYQIDDLLEDPRRSPG